MTHVRERLVSWLMADGFDRDTAMMEVETYLDHGLAALTDTPREAIARYLTENVSHGETRA